MDQSGANSRNQKIHITFSFFFWKINIKKHQKNRTDPNVWALRCCTNYNRWFVPSDIQNQMVCTERKRIKIKVQQTNIFAEISRNPLGVQSSQTSTNNVVDSLTQISARRETLASCTSKRLTTVLQNDKKGFVSNFQTMHLNLTLLECNNLKFLSAKRNVLIFSFLSKILIS